MASNRVAAARSLAWACPPGTSAAWLCWGILSFPWVSLVTLSTQHLFFPVSLSQVQPRHALVPAGALGELPRFPTALWCKHAWVGEETWNCRSQLSRADCISVLHWNQRHYSSGQLSRFPPFPMTKLITSFPNSSIWPRIWSHTRTPGASSDCVDVV